MTGVSRHGAFLRHHLWRTVFASTGGLTVTGPLPRGPAVLVVNHSSHADTAALMAALPPGGRPVFAAAADYWFTGPVRRLLVTTLAAALPVHRHAEGSYAGLRAAATDVIADGGIVIVYPEGTRSTDGAVGGFASGAVRLADDLAVPLVPAALLGTGDVLPKHGGFRPCPVEVRFDTPFDSTGMAEDAATAGTVSALLRDVVLALRDAGPVADPRSPLGERVARFVRSPLGIASAFAWGFAEAVSWPVIAEMHLAFVAVARPERMVRSSVALAAGSVTGVVLTASLTRRGHVPPAPLTTAGMRAAAAAHLAEGARGIRHQAFNGIPVKVYAVQAGLAGVPLPGLAAVAAAERTARIVGVGLVSSVVAGVLRAPVRRRYGSWVLVAGAGWAVGVAATMRRWR